MHCLIGEIQQFEPENTILNLHSDILVSPITTPKKSYLTSINLLELVSKDNITLFNRWI